MGLLQHHTLLASLYHNNPTQMFHSPCHLKSKLSFCQSQHVCAFIFFVHILMHNCDKHVHHIIFHAKFDVFFKEITTFILFFNLALNNVQQIVIFHLLSDFNVLHINLLACKMSALFNIQ